MSQIGSRLTAAGMGAVLTLTPDAGGPIAPDGAGNINLFGGTGIETSGAGNTISISVDATVATQYDADAGSAVPAAGILNIVGNGSVSTTGAGNTITISVAGSGIAWTVVTTPQIGSNGNGYFANDAGVVTIALPAVSAVGDTFEVVDMSGNGWDISQGVGQSIHIGNITTTVGVVGGLTSNLMGDWVELVCNVANTTWFANAKQGNINVL